MGDEHSLMSERIRKRNAYDGPLGCEKPGRAVHTQYLRLSS